VDTARLRKQFERARQAAAMPDYDICRTRAAVASFFDAMMWNFTGFLNKSRRLHWTRAFSLAGRMQEYWLRKAEDARPTTPFDLDIWEFEKYLCRTCRSFFNNGVLTASGIEAMGHFADYLLACGTIGEQKREELRDGCRNLYRQALATYDSTAPVPRIMPALDYDRVSGPSSG